MKSVDAQVMHIVIDNVLKEYGVGLSHGSNFHLSTKSESIMVSSGRFTSVSKETAA
jgi:hypothetical protein